jgi:hypothetical protein
MKGIVFTEFLDMVEEAFGLETVDRIIEASALSTDGAYSAIGTYDHMEMVRLVGNLSKETGKPIPALLQAYGEHLFARFSKKFPVFFERPKTCFEFLNSIEGTIHVEVLKLHPDAELPKFKADIVSDREMLLHYQSSRPFADLAHGLIAGCARHYGEDMTIERESFGATAGTNVCFKLTRN